MNHRIAPNRVAMACVVAFLGCSTMAPPTPVAPLADCDDMNCKVTVKVNDCTRVDGFDVRPYELFVNAPKHIHWELEGNLYKFTEFGIDIKKNDGVFETPKVYANGTKFRWKDRHSGAPGFELKAYEYTVNVTRIDGSVLCGTFDPKIVNQ